MEDNIIYRQCGKDPLYKTWHALKEHLFLYVHSGSGNIVSTEQVFHIKKGALVFIAADTNHYTMPDEPKVYERSKLIIPPSSINKVLELLGEKNCFKKFSDKAIVYAEIEEAAQKEIEAVFNEISICNTDDEQELILLSCCIKLLFYLNKYSKASTSIAIGIMGKAIDYISKNISSDIDIDSICSVVGISKYYFCRQFKKHTGMTVMNYILKTRIILAKSDLEKTNLSITEISERYGFSSASYFCRIFKEAENCSPLQYRKKTHI